VEAPGPSPFFSAHAAAYAASPGHARGDDLVALVAALTPRPGEQAADVATGTGHTALALAARGVRVVGVDPTPAMLAEAARLAAAQGLAGAVRWEQAAVDAMPLPAAAFDIVSCRRAFHHFADPPAALAALVRLLAPGGRLGISDMCPSVETAGLVNDLERLRDPGHRRALTEPEWRSLLADAQLTVRTWQVLVEPQPWARWLAPVAVDGPEAEAVHRAWRAAPAAARAALTGDGPDIWLKRRLVCVATRD
jgi:SAM-dependent methyltransferase